MRNLFLFSCWCLLFLTENVSAQEVYDDNYYLTHTLHNLELPPNSHHVLVVGDWGRNGHFHQRSVAKWMDIASAMSGAEFIISTGDNFYVNGVASVNDPYWLSSFENVYVGPHLFIDWHPVLGNHDYRGNWQAQIDYSAISRRWEMPAPYYHKQLSLAEGGEALLLFIDTNPLNPEYRDQPKYAQAMQQNAPQQLAWIEQQLRDSKAQWKIVIGHHPLYTSGKRYGKTDDIRQVLEPLLEKYKVHAYFAGHEHDLQHNRPNGKTVEHFVSGAGSDIRPVKQREFTAFAESQAGFALLSIAREALLVQFINDQGEVIYRYRIEKH